MSRSYPYPKVTPLINFVTALAMAGACVLFLVLAGATESIWVALFAISVFGAVIVIYATPLLTDHWIAEGQLKLRYGFVFRADVKLANIASVRALVKGDSAKGALDLTTEKTRRVLLKLIKKQRFQHALWLSYESIVFSVEDVPGMVGALGGERS
jgi:hypothetical protein